jgi:hypothetical protein
MLRTAILSRWLISLGCAALVTPVLVTSALADEADGCSHFSWDVTHEVNLMKQTGVAVTAAMAPGAQAPLVKIDQLYDVKLSPQSKITYGAKPGKTSTNDSAQGGLVRFHVSKAGLYRVSLTSGHWIDVVDGTELVKSKDFSGSHDCARPHKIVEFELPAGKDLILQFSGSADTSVTMAITPVAAAAAN